MESQVIIELLSDIIQRLNNIETKLQTTTMRQIVDRRQESIERYRVAYNRQHGYPDGVILPTNPGAEDEID
jgi:fumarylacetoacetate (FAA) hydrolase family protein